MRSIAIACLFAYACLLACVQADDVEAQHWWPPPTTSGTNFIAVLGGGRGTVPSAQFYLTVNDAAQTATYSFWMSNIQGYTMSHIHVGAAGTNGPPVVFLLPAFVAGSPNPPAALPQIPPFDICTLGYTGAFTAAQLVQPAPPGTFTWANFMSNLVAGTLYVNIHTATAPAGLIRAQLMPARYNMWSTTCPVKGWKSLSTPKK